MAMAVTYCFRRRIRGRRLHRLYRHSQTVAEAEAEAGTLVAPSAMRTLRRQPMAVVTVTRCFRRRIRGRKATDSGRHVRLRFFFAVMPVFSILSMNIRTGHPHCDSVM